MFADAVFTDFYVFQIACNDRFTDNRWARVFCHQSSTTAGDGDDHRDKHQHRHADGALALVDQLTKPVRWVECVESMAEQGVTHMIECGPGKVLTGLGKRINKSITGAVINDMASITKALELTSNS